MANDTKRTSHALLVLGVFAIYAGFVIWMYVTEPLLLLVFGAALVVILVRESGTLPARDRAGPTAQSLDVLKRAQRSSIRR